MRLLVGGLAHETNTFSSKPTTVADFQLPGCWSEGEQLRKKRQGTNTGIAGFMSEADARGIELVLTVSTNAAPMGRCDDEIVDIFLDRLFAGLDAGPKIDGILLELHGAMVTVSDDDAEGLVLERVRQRVGPEMPIVVTLDLHGHITQRMVDHATTLVIYKTCAHAVPAATSAKFLVLCSHLRAMVLSCCSRQTRILTAIRERLKPSASSPTRSMAMSLPRWLWPSRPSSHWSTCSSPPAASHESSWSSCQHSSTPLSPRPQELHRHLWLRGVAGGGGTPTYSRRAWQWGSRGQTFHMLAWPSSSARTMIPPQRSN